MSTVLICMEACKMPIAACKARSHWQIGRSDRKVGHGECELLAAGQAVTGLVDLGKQQH
jgi:hypothetical protein